MWNTRKRLGWLHTLRRKHCSVAGWCCSLLSTTCRRHDGVCFTLACFGYFGVGNLGDLEWKCSDSRMSPKMVEGLEEFVAFQVSIGGQRALEPMPPAFGFHSAAPENYRNR